MTDVNEETTVAPTEQNYGDDPLQVRQTDKYQTEYVQSFVEKWAEGFDVVYERRVKREASWLMQIAYKSFYRLFDRFSYLKIPHDAGDFSLMDKRVVRSVLQFPERDFFLRGVRAFVGFRQTGIDYVRPERMFGVSTNNFIKNIGWAKKGILSFSQTPLNLLSTAGLLGMGVFGALGLLQTAARLLFPELAPKGVTTLLLATLFFGSVNLFAISLVGEYIAKIFEEVKRRPHFLRRSIVRDGFSRIIIVNGHGGNVTALTNICQELTVELSDVYGCVRLVALSYWTVPQVEVAFSVDVRAADSVAVTPFRGLGLEDSAADTAAALLSGIVVRAPQAAAVVEPQLHKQSSYQQRRPMAAAVVEPQLH